MRHPAEPALYALLTVAALLWVLSLRDVSLKVRPAVAFAPATVVAEIIVPRDAENRHLMVVLYCGEFLAQRSDRDLDGDAEPSAAFRWTYRDLPACEYDAQAVLTRQDHRGRVTFRNARQTVTILER